MYSTILVLLCTVVGSISKSSSVKVWKGFFLAFIIPGNVGNLGVCTLCKQIALTGKFTRLLQHFLQSVIKQLPSRHSLRFVYLTLSTIFQVYSQVLVLLGHLLHQ